MMTIQQEIYQTICIIKIGIDLSKQTNTSISQQVNFVGKLEEGNGTTIFLLLKKSEKQF